MQLPLIGKVSKFSPPWIVGLLLVGLVGVSSASFVAVQRLRPKPDIAGLTVPVKSQPLTVRITASGTVTPFQTVNLTPKAAGRIARLLVEQGDRVQRGQVIAQMESEELETQRAQLQAVLAQAQARLALVENGSRSEEIGQAQATVAQAEAQVTQAESRLLLSSERVRRNQALFNEGAISRDRLDEVLNEERNARANLEQAQSRVNELRQRTQQLQNGSRPEEIAQAEAQVAEAAARLRNLETQLGDTQIRAPFSGIIAQKYATEGAFVTPQTAASSTSSATSTSIVALANGLEVLAEVPEVDIGQIKPGQEVEIRADAYPDQVFKGRVRLIAPAAVKEQNVTFFQVRVAIDQGKDKLRSGMNVNLEFLGDTLPNALVVPTSAIVTLKGEPGVLIPDEKNEPKFLPVTIGSTLGNQTQILSGLQPGQRVFEELPEGKKFENIKKVREN